MRQIRVARSVCILCAVALVAVGPVFAESPVASPKVESAQIDWHPTGRTAVSLTVSGPEGFYLRQRFAPGEEVIFSLFDGDGTLRPAGAYAFEIKALRQLDEETRARLESARERGGESALSKTSAETVPPVVSGYFSIVDGAVEIGGKAEEVGPSAGATLAPKATVLTIADGVINNSLCVGAICSSSPTFSDSTILLTEVNTRIKFADTSNAPYPNNDWEIEANSDVSGGQSYLGFNDCGPSSNQGGCTAALVFGVEAGAPQHSLYVESDGDVGFGTLNPAARLHAVDGDSPALRLEQDGSSGFTPQIWDVAGNETNFFVRDLTGGSTYPFRIRPGAPTSSIDIAASGDVGIGTSSPQAKLHLQEFGAVRYRLDNTNAGTQWDTNNDGNGDFAISLVGTGGNELEIEQDGDIGNCGNPDHDFVISSGTSCTATPRSWIDAGSTSFSTSSSRSYKENLQAVAVPDILSRIRAVPVYEYDFIGGPKDRIGLVAEDFHQVFERGSDKELNGQEVQVAMWLAIQALDEKDQKLEAKEAEISDLKSRLETLNEQLTARQERAEQEIAQLKALLGVSED